MTLPARAIGPFHVSAVSLGAMNLSHAYGAPLSEDAGARVLNRALDLGVTMLDTAALYGSGANERLLSQAVMHRRSEFTLASKCVLDLIDGKRVLDGRPETIAGTLERALVRLGTDHIDLYYLHRLDKAVPIEESVGALVRAKESGKIGAIGLSEMSADTLRRAHAVHPIAAMQSEYSAMVRNPEIAVLDACRELGTSFVAFSPLMRGMLAGGIANANYAPGDIRASMPSFTGDNLTGNLALAACFFDLARDADCTPAQLALAWVLARGDHVIALPGTTSIDHLKDDIEGATVSVSTDTVAAIDALFARRSVKGPRYPAQMQSWIDTEIWPDEELA